MRGERLANFPLSERWSIPAYAEKTRITSPTRSPQFDQTPHTRGRVSRRAIFPGPRPINPRIREERRIHSQYRLPPAYAGKSGGRALERSDRGDQPPHTRGRALNWFAIPARTSINPRIRGEELVNTTTADKHMRSIPAYAGKRVGAPSRSVRAQINPRVRGEEVLRVLPRRFSL